MNDNTSSFLISNNSISYWQKNGLKPALGFEIALLEDFIEAKAPIGYTEFMTSFGGVEFGSDIPNQFTYTYDDLEHPKRKKQVIGHIKTPERALRYYKGLMSDDDLEFTRHLLPFAMDLGQGELLIEFGQPTERIFYWDFDNHDWTNAQMRLGFVACNMYEFINNLELS